MNKVFTPVDIALDRPAHALKLIWEDRHQSNFPLDALREACPCAVCRGGHEFMGAEHDPNLIELVPVQKYDAKQIQLVGSYALQITWSDNHSAGIYTWEYLRRICPCEQCQSRQ